MQYIDIATFNVNNLYVRYKFGSSYPGDVSKKSFIKSQATSGIGYLPSNVKGSFEIWNDTQRKIAARCINNDTNSFPDVVFLQEVESLIALRAFNDKYLGSYYKKALLIDSHDFRQIDIGVLTNLDIENIKTHVDDPDPENPNYYLFSRDCLEVEFILKNKKTFTVFVNHFKSKFVDNRTKNKAKEIQSSDEKRKRQALKVLDIIKERFPGNKIDTAMFAVIGDFNDTPFSSSVSPLFKSGFLFDPIQRLPENERWTYYWKGHSVSQIDNILISPKLEKITDAILPRIERRGICFERVLRDGKPGPKSINYENGHNGANGKKIDFRFDRFAEVDCDNRASDHCAVFFKVPV